MPPKPTRHYSVGDLVFAKIKGYPPWPARVEKEFPVGYKPYPGRHPVFFFGTYESAVVSSKDIYPYEQYKHQLGIKRKMKNFNEGLEEIEKHPNLTMDSEELQRLREERELNANSKMDTDDDDDSDVSFAKSEDEDSDYSDTFDDLGSENGSKKKIKSGSRHNSSKKKKARLLSESSDSDKLSSEKIRKKSSGNKKNNKKLLKTDKNGIKNKNKFKQADFIQGTTSKPGKNRKRVKISDSEVEISEESDKNDDDVEELSPVQKIDKNSDYEQFESDDGEKKIQKRSSRTIVTDSDNDSRSKDDDNKVNDDNLNNNDNDNNKTFKYDDNFSDDVLKLKQKLQDEKLAQKLEEKEKEKERRKREKMEQKRLERLKMAQKSKKDDSGNVKSVKDILTEIDNHIKGSLSKNNANVDKCLEAMGRIDELKITSNSISNYSDILKELIQTLRKCRKYKPDERVREKADLYLNKLKDVFSQTDSSQVTSSTDVKATECDEQTKNQKNGEIKSMEDREATGDNGSNEPETVSSEKSPPSFDHSASVNTDSIDAHHSEGED